MGKASKTVKNKQPRVVQRKQEHVDWKTRFDFKRLEGRTTDPEALELDIARNYFQSGLLLARMGMMGQAAQQIARAYLMDPRAINWMTTLPPGEEEEASKIVLFWDLIDPLIKANEKSLDSHIMILILLRFQTAAVKDGKRVIREQGLTIAGDVLDVLETNPFKKFKPFGEGFSRPRLLLEIAQMHVFLGEFDEAAEYLSLALKIDPGYLPARKEQAALWAVAGMEDDATVFAENKEVAELLHEDSPWLCAIYARLAVLALKNPKLGTVQEAEQYFDKCLRSVKRKNELYKDAKLGDHATLEKCKREFLVYWNGPALRRKVREGLDAAVQAALATKDGDGGATDPAKKLLLRSCLTCGKTAEDVVEKVLLTCSGCCKVAYCSRKCQLADWGDHKEFCKMYPTRKKSRDDTKALEESTTEDIVSPNSESTGTTTKSSTENNEGNEVTQTSAEPGTNNQTDKAAMIPAETDSDSGFAGLD